MQKIFTLPITLKDGDVGEFEAVFSTFDVVDLDGDIVRRSAITEGQKIPLLWGHDSRAMPVGMGVVHATQTQAVVRGKFIDSSIGRDAHATVRATQDLQELSWGFQITKANDIVEDGVTHREILETDQFEASFVLRGAAGPGRTGVLGVKAKLPEQIRAAGKAVQEAIDRAKDVSRLRFKDGKTLGVESAEALAGMVKNLSEANEFVQGLANQEIGDGEPTATATMLQARLTMLRQQALGEH